MRLIKAPAAKLAGLVVALLVVGCADDPEQQTAEPAVDVWVGAVADSDVMVALAERDGTTTLFFCGGNTALDTRTRWFNEAELPMGRFSFMANGWRVDGAINDEAATGFVQPEDGEESAWSAAPVKPETAAGLYEGVAPCGKLGLIVLQPTPDDEPSGQGACIRVENEVTIIEQVNPVRLERDAGGGIAVTVGDSEEEFKVLPVTAAAR